MRRLNDSGDAEQGSMGPGTDLIISLLAVLLLVLSTLTVDYKKVIEELDFFKSKNQELTVLKKRLDSLEIHTKSQYASLIRKENELNSLELFKSDFLEEQKLLTKIANSQRDIIQGLANEFNSQSIIKNTDSTEFEIPTGISGGEIKIRNTVTSQRIFFGSNILFDKQESLLKKEGKYVLKKVGNAVKFQLSKINEIQILGHADTSGEEDFNLDLAGDRANSVYKYFQSIGISPLDIVLSATSYGEFMPVNRSYTGDDFSLKLLEEANAPSLKAKNRRIEVVLKF